MGTSAITSSSPPANYQLNKDVNMVKCSKCKKRKKGFRFWKNQRKRNGLTSWCKNCVNKKSAKWRKENSEYVESCKPKKRKMDLEYQKNKSATIPGYKTEEYRVYREKYPEKYKAQQRANQAILSGKIKRSPCEVCGENRKYRVHAHHDDYSKPYEVRFLCGIHHKEAHKTT